MKGPSARTFTDFRIRTKLAVGFAAVFLVALAVAAVGAFAVLSVQSSADDATQKGDRLNAIALELQTHVASAQRDVSDFNVRAQAIGAAADDTYGPLVATELKSARSLVDEAGNLAPQQKDALSHISQDLDRFESSYRLLVESWKVRGTGDTGRQGDFQAHARNIEDLLVARTAADRVLAAALVTRRAGQGYFASASIQEATRTSGALAALKSEADASPTLKPEEKAVIKAEVDEESAAFNDIVAADRSLNSAVGIFTGTSKSITASAQEIATAGLAAARSAHDDIGATSDSAVRSLSLITLVGLLLAALFVLFLARTITTPLAKLADVANRMSLGELDVAIDVRGKDEVGQLAESLRRMQASLRAAIDRLRARRAA